MPTIQISCNQFIRQSQVPSSGNVITSIRENTTREPTHTWEAGVGGTGVNPSGRTPNNSTFMRFEELANIPRGATIVNATLEWGINDYDWRTSLTHKVCACENFGNWLNGLNQPRLYNNVNVASYTVPGNVKTRFSGNITSAIQEVVDRGLKCFKIYTSAGKNRKYYSNIANLTIEYKASTGKPGITIVSTDCTNLQSQNDVVVRATRPSEASSSETVYYNYTIWTGSQSRSTGWTTATEVTLPALGNPGNLNYIKVTSSFFSNGDYPTDSDIVTITKNIAPVVNFNYTNANNLIWYNNSLVVNGAVTFNYNSSDSSIKNWESLTTTFYVNGSAVNSSTNTSGTFSYTFDSGKNYNVYITASDGFLTTRSNTINVIGALPPSLNIGTLNNRVPCNSTLTNTVIATLRTSGTTINNFNLTAYHRSGGLTSQVGSKTDLANSITLSVQLPIYEYGESNIQYYYFTSTLTDNIGQTVSITSNETMANRIPSTVNDFIIDRTQPDINGVTSSIQELENGYDRLYAPENDIIVFNWDAALDREIDRITYQIQRNEIDLVNTTALTYNYTLTGIDVQNFRIKSNDVLNNGVSFVDANTTLKVHTKISIAPEVDLKCYAEYVEGIDTDNNYEIINGVKLIDVTDSLAEGEITNYLKFTVPSTYTESCLTNNTRFGISIYTEDDGVKILKESHISEQGVFELFIQHDITTDLETKISFDVYYIDRFEFLSTNITEMGPYDVIKKVPIPQVMGTLGGGYRWIFGNPEQLPVQNHILKPIFCCNVLNPNSTQYILNAQLYNEEQTLIETVSNIYPNNNIIGSPSDVIPSENIKAWCFNTSLELETNYYIIITLTFTNGGLVSQTSFNQNALYIVSKKYNHDRIFSEHWKVDEIIRTSHINLINDYIEKLYATYGFTIPNYIFDVNYGDLIIAQNNDKSVQINPLPYNEDPTVVEPLNYNLCPTFNQWLNSNNEKLEVENKYSITLNSNLNEITSMYIPWKCRSDYMKISFTTNINSSDSGKLFNYELEFYDYYKNRIGVYTHVLPLLIPDDVTLGTNTQLFFENIYDTVTLGSHILLNNVSYLKLKLSLYPEDQDGISTITLKNILLTDDLNADYINYDTYNYEPITLQYGAKNSWIQRCNLAMYTLYEKLRSNYLNITGIPTNNIVTSKNNNNYISINTLDVDDFITSDTIKISKTEESFRCLGYGEIKIPTALIPSGNTININYDMEINDSLETPLKSGAVWSDINTKIADLDFNTEYTATANIKYISILIPGMVERDITFHNIRIQETGWQYTNSSIQLNPYMRGTIITAEQDLNNLSLETKGIFSYLNEF